MSPSSFTAPDVQQALPRPDLTVALRFANGEWRLFDVRPFLPSEEGTRGLAFAPLKRWEYFSALHVEDGTVVWPDGQDFDPATLYAQSSPIPSASADRTTTRVNDKPEKGGNNAPSMPDGGMGGMDF